MLKDRKSFGRWTAYLASSAGLVGLIAGLPAAAQTAPAQNGVTQQDETAGADTAADDIVVTGTLLRGIAPVGTNVVGLNREEITATGATNTNDVLARIPQITNFFNQVVNTGLGNLGSVSARPNIRNLNTFGGGNTTLLLLDGQRLAGVGVIYTSPDPDVVPPGALEKVEVVADGGSAIYGSDAVGGVINLITRRRFSGLEASGRYGFADDYYQYDANLVAGTDWGSGGLYASFTYSKHDDIFGRDRDYVRSITPGNSCAPGTLTANNTTYALPAGFTGTGAGLVAGTRNSCDLTDNANIVPAERRYSAFAGFNQQLGEGIDFNVRGYYTNRRTDLQRDQVRSSVTIAATNPYYASAIGGSQQVGFSYAPVFGPTQHARTDLEQWGVTPSIDVTLTDKWKLRASAGYSESDVVNVGEIINPIAQAAAAAGTTTATALNPYNIGATNPAVLTAIRNFEEYSRGRQNVLSARAVLDGTLFNWAGGDVRVAVGGEYLREEINSDFGNRVPGTGTLLSSDGGRRSVKSVYGEIVVPVFGDDNRVPGFYSLLVSGSGRYDHYSDLNDGTFNPKIGVTWQPFKELTLRGNYGTSFNAPSLADTNAVDQRIEANVGSLIFLLAKPGDLTFPLPGIFTINRPVLVVAGGNPDLKPQTAKTFSVGFDFDVPFAPGLRLSSTYWNVNFKDQISLPTNCLLNPTITYTVNCQRFVNDNPTLAEVLAVSNGQLTGPFPTIQAAFANPLLQPYVLFDARRVNIGRVQTDGVDFNASFFRATGFGSINASVGGAYALSRFSKFLGQARVDEYRTGVSQLNLTANVGATIGNFGAQANLYHTAGYDIGATATAPAGHVESFDVVNLFFSYKLQGEGLASDLAVTLSVNNVFDNDPPFINSGNGYANGSTLGRLVQFGISKKF